VKPLPLFHAATAKARKMWRIAAQLKTEAQNAD
jgi:hypothetical protein